MKSYFWGIESGKILGKIKQDLQQNLFKTRLTELINMEHPLVKLAHEISWDKMESEFEKLFSESGRPYLYLTADKYSSIKRYAGEFLQELDFRSAPIATDILRAVDILRQLYKGEIKKIPEKLPSGFIRKRWEERVFTENGTDRKFYELCIFSELKNHLRSGDLWVQGSRQYKDFEDYLIPEDLFLAMKDENNLPLDIPLDATQYLTEKIKQLEDQMEIACRLAEENALPEASVSNDRIKIKPLDNAVPPEAETLSTKVYRLLPYIKITDLLQEVDGWTHFSDHFTHLKSGDKAEDKNLMLTVILSDAINLGLRKMSDASPGISYSKLSWLQAWHIRDETYSSALAEIINYHYKHPFSGYWGEGKTSSSDGQRFAVGSRAHKRGNINPKYGSSPGVQFYTHISDQYAPYPTNVITVGTRDAPYTLDGLLYHESDLQIEEH
ncbi:Tn3 family transposase, partial [Chryseobacterium sp. HMWF001]|uniref:Tn3 family transposase n=1 Tax=Chryseobacterium sp. HMWF001 TaxID=2056839 RepID=UPI0013FD2748